MRYMHDVYFHFEFIQKILYFLVTTFEHVCLAKTLYEVHKNFLKHEDNLLLPLFIEEHFSHIFTG